MLHCLLVLKYETPLDDRLHRLLGSSAAAVWGRGLSAIPAHVEQLEKDNLFSAVETMVVVFLCSSRLEGRLGDGHFSL